MSGFVFFLVLLTLVVIKEEEVCSEVVVTEELVEVAALLLGGTPRAAHAVGKATDLTHLKDVVLLLGGDVLELFGHELGSHAVLYRLEHAEGVGDGRLAHTYHIAILDVLRGFHCYTVHRYLPFLTGVRSHRTGLIQAYGPKPFVYSSFHAVIIENFFGGLLNPPLKGRTSSSPLLGGVRGGSSSFLIKLIHRYGDTC